MRLIRLKEVMSISGLGRSSIYKFMEDGRFPMSISLGERAIAWEETEINEWVEEKVRCRNENTLVLPCVKNEITEEMVIKFIKKKFNQCGVATAIDWLMKAVDWNK